MAMVPRVELLKPWLAAEAQPLRSALAGSADVGHGRLPGQLAAAASW